MYILYQPLQKTVLFLNFSNVALKWIASNWCVPLPWRAAPRLLIIGPQVIEIAEGLAYLHQSGIIHGDLKGNNALISSGEHILLCDFGLAKHVTSRTSTSLRGMGSIPWQSPELLQDSGRRTFQSDVYAFGILVYEVSAGFSNILVIAVDLRRLERF